MQVSPIVSSLRQDVRVASGGFTAIELLVTMAILAVLATLAAPSFTSMIERWRVVNTSEDMRSLIYFARSEAIKRGGGVEIKPNSPGDWNSGWIATHTGTTDPLQVANAPNTVAVTGVSSIKFDRWGMVAPPLPGIQFYPQGKTSADAASRRLCMSSGGRVRIVAGSTCST